MTDSRARYRSQENDLYIPHWSADVPADRQQGSELVLAGNHYNVRDGQNNSEVNEAVFRTRNHRLVDDAFTDLGGQHPRVWRIGQKPQQGENDDERVVVLGVDDEDFYLYVDFIDYFGGCARGWSRRTQKIIPQFLD